MSSEMIKDIEDYPFVVTIDDKYSKYEYVFYLPDEICIKDIAEVIAKHYRIKLPEGKYVEQDHNL